MADRVLVVGLDCAEPRLVFDLWADLLPNLSRLRNEGVWGNLRSTDPPITVPAWTCMFSSRDPGEHGFYGFRNRKDYSYDGLVFADSTYIKLPLLWQLFARQRKRSILVGVPQTYPPRPIKGMLIADFLTPDESAEYTYPPELKDEINRVADGEYIIDVKNFRTDDKAWLLDSIYRMTRRRFKVIKHLMVKYPWDLFIFVEMGPDRIHHGFWRFFDRTHRLYVPNNEYENAIRDYYIELDSLVGEVLELVDE
ncbi:MAG TPA: phosphodiesterase, partial [Proteobacteria bacterium]|nr:phosphodiesterase [Pseudomonadota bacterium]